jgi:hypothetical protein
MAVGVRLDHGNDGPVLDNRLYCMKIMRYC